MATEPATISRIEHIPGVSITSSRLIDRLKTGTPGDVITDEDLTSVCGKDTRPNGKGYSSLQTAIRYCEREHNVVWRRIKGADCIKCLEWSERLEQDNKYRRHIHRTAKRSVRVVNSIDTSELKPSDQREVNIRTAQMMTLASMSSADMRKKLEARDIQEPLDMPKLLEAMRNGSN